MIYSLPPARREAFGTLSQTCLKCHQWHNFIKRLWGEGSVHQHPPISGAALPPACRVLMLMSFVLSIALHVPPVPCARKSSARSFAGQGSTGPEYLKPSADEAGGRLCTCPYPQERERCFLPRVKGRFVPLRGAIQEAKEWSKSWNLSLVRRQSYSCWACFGKTVPHQLLSCTQGPEQPTRPTVTCKLQRTSF